MPIIKWEEIEENIEEYTPIPDTDKMLFQVHSVEEKSTKDGDEMWNLKLECLEEAHYGRYVWDNWVFKEGRGLSRIKLACKALGMVVTGETNLLQSTIKGKKFLADIRSEKYTADGKEKLKNVIPFKGYHSLDEAVSSCNTGSKQTAEHKKTILKPEDLPF